MPYAPLSPCPKTGCPRLCAPGKRRCTEHGGEEQREYDKARGNSAARGYGKKWRKIRAMVLRRDPICKACGDAWSKEADHIVPKRKGGRDSLDNLQGLCKSCHSRKTAGESGGFRKRERGYG